MYIKTYILHRYRDLRIFIQEIAFYNIIWMELLSGTLPANSKLLSETLPANSNLLSGTLPANKKLLSRTLTANNKM